MSKQQSKKNAFATSYQDKHEFINWAHELNEAPIKQFAAKGFQQYVVQTEEAHLRWPVSYEHGHAPEVKKKA